MSRIQLEMLSDALTQFIDNSADLDDEDITEAERRKLAAAQAMLDEVDAQLANV